MERHIFSKLLNKEDNHYVIQDAMDLIRKGIDKLTPFVEDEDKEKLDEFYHWLSNID